MKRTDGGISDPSVPPTATDEVARRGSYPMRSISGTQMRPMVEAQAMDDPEMAENPPQPSTDAIATPPGSCRSQTAAAS